MRMWKWMAASVLTFGLLAGGQARSADDRGVEWVDRQLKAVALPEQGYGPDQVAWAESLPRALELAKQHHRLLYFLVDRGDVSKGRA